ncbi:hypothetical protein [Kitasatospora sp. MBT63]|uniref:hypothetical protein n=1 Tax=Kitasatospora sp. MBT63 TaxID=1444768 RepID=UPI00068FF475|nr:hypothetical protein [Kitasatospora sp. MBT63]
MHEKADQDGGAATTPTDPADPPAAALERALRLLHGRAGRTGRIILGLAGPPAAGKSTLARYLVDEVNRREGPDTAAHLPLDGFHLSNTQLDRLGLRTRKGAPETFDAWGYAALVTRAATERFRDIYVPDFDRDLDEPIAARHIIRPHTRLVVTEGNYLAVPAAPWQTVRGLLRELWWVEAHDTVRAERLLRRHRSTGETRESAEQRIAVNDHPNGEYVRPGAAGCDWAVPSGHLPSATDGRTVL